MLRCDWLKNVRSIRKWISIRFLCVAFTKLFYAPVSHHSTLLYYYTSYFVRRTSCKSICLDVVKEARPRPRQRPDHSELDFSSLLDVSTDSFEKVTMLTESDQVHLCTWLLSWNIWAPKSWSWLVTLPEITRKQESYQDIFNWPSETTKNWTSFCLESPSLKVESCQTSKLYFSPRRTRKQQRNRSSICFLLKNGSIQNRTSL